MRCDDQKLGLLLPFILRLVQDILIVEFNVDGSSSAGNRFDVVFDVFERDRRSIEMHDGFGEPSRL